jgi:hypothetical protein
MKETKIECRDSREIAGGTTTESIVKRNAARRTCVSSQNRARATPPSKKSVNSTSRGLVDSGTSIVIGILVSRRRHAYRPAE